MAPMAQRLQVANTVIPALTQRENVIDVCRRLAALLTLRLAAQLGGPAALPVAIIATGYLRWPGLRRAGVRATAPTCQSDTRTARL
jgi:hypothetical protein